MVRGINFRIISQEGLKELIHYMCLEITPLILVPYLPRANELQRQVSSNAEMALAILIYYDT